MKEQKILTRFVALVIISTLNVSLLASQDSNDFKSKGPSKLSLLKTTLHKKVPIYERGIWPESKAFEKSIRGSDLPSGYADKMRTWLPIILNKDFLPDKIDSTKWHGIPKLHKGHSFVLGQFYNPTREALVQFQADGVHLCITATSEKYFSVDVANITDDKIIQVITKLLNYPEEKVGKISIEKHFQEISDNENKIYVCYGKLRCENYDETKPSTPAGENIRTWWNYIPFWIVDGTVSINTTTVKWETDPVTLKGIFFKLGS